MTHDAQQPELKPYTGTYIMYLSEGKLIITGREKYKNFKAVFPLHEVDDYLSKSRPHTPAPTDEQCLICSDAIARAATLAENKRVLDAIKEWRKEKELKGENPEDCVSAWLEEDIMLESLRQKAGEQG
jgi:hypothetical protein